MRWIRSNMAFGSRLALFALAVQLILSFGHVHPGDFAGAGPAAAATSGNAAADLPQTPPNPKPYPLAGDYCSICASIQLAGASLAPVAPALPLPADFRPVRPQRPVASKTTDSPRLLFQARAPPLA
jgi:hypothetical protein